MFNSLKAPVVVAIFSLVGQFLHAAEAPIDAKLACHPFVAGGVGQALAQVEEKAERLGDDVVKNVRALGVYVPVGTVNKIRRHLVDMRNLRPKFRISEESLREYRELEEKIEVLVRGVIAHPRNSAVFAPANGRATPISAGTNITRYLQLTRSIKLEVRIALMVYVTAYQHSLLLQDGQYEKMSDADGAFYNYRDVISVLLNLRNARRGEFGRLSAAQLTALQTRSRNERKTIVDRYLSNPALPAEVEAVINMMVTKSSPDLPLYAFHDEVAAVEAQINSGKPRDLHWRLSPLWSEGSITVQSPGAKERIRRELRRLVIEANERRFMSDEIYKQFAKLEADLRVLDLILSEI